MKTVFVSHGNAVKRYGYMKQKSDALTGLHAEHYQCAPGIDCDLAIRQLELKGFTAMGRTDREPVPFRLPFDWNGTDPDDRNWMFQLHAWRMLDPYLYMMLKDGGKHACFEHCIAVVSDWIRDNIFGKPGTFSWYDMSTGIRASKLALLTRAAPAFDCDLSKISNFDIMINQHFLHLMNPKELNKGNHGLFQMQGLKSLASAFPEHPVSGDAEEYAVQNMTNLIKAQMGEHGVHTENSPDYHFFACRRISVILDSPDWQNSETAFARALMTKSEKVKPWLTDAANRVVPIGDSSQRFEKPAHMVSLREWPHQADRDYIGAILDGYGVVRSRPELPLKDSSFLFFSASYHSNTHKHDDCLSFVWQEGGADILIDPGKYGYQQGKTRAYFRSRRAHNTIEFNNISFPKDKRPAYGSGIKKLMPLANGAWSLRAEAPCSATGDMHQRRILFKPGRSLVVFDRIVPAGKDENSYTLWWHFPPKAQPRLEGTSCTISGLADKRTLRIRHASNGEGRTVKIFEGQEKPSLQGWISSSYLKCEPSPVLGMSGTTSGVLNAITVFNWEEDILLPNDLTTEEYALASSLNL